MFEKKKYIANNVKTKHFDKSKATVQIKLEKLSEDWPLNMNTW